MSNILFVRLGLLIALKNAVVCLIYLMAGSGMAALWWAVLTVAAILFITQMVWPSMSDAEKAAVTPRTGRVSDKEYTQ